MCRPDLGQKSAHTHQKRRRRAESDIKNSRAGFGLIVPFTRWERLPEDGRGSLGVLSFHCTANFVVYMYTARLRTATGSHAIYAMTIAPKRVRLFVALVATHNPTVDRSLWRQKWGAGDAQETAMETMECPANVLCKRSRANCFRPWNALF